MNKKILFLVLLGILVLPSFAFAQVSLEQIVSNIVGAAWIVATAIVVIFWLATGVLFLVAQGAPEKLNKAKVALFTSIAGTAIIILAYSIKGIIEGILFRGA